MQPATQSPPALYAQLSILERFNAQPVIERYTRASSSYYYDPAQARYCVRAGKVRNRAKSRGKSGLSPRLVCGSSYKKYSKRVNDFCIASSNGG